MIARVPTTAFLAPWLFLIAATHLPGTAHALCVDYGDYIHLTATVEMEGGNPRVVEDVCLAGDYVYLACGVNGLQVVDVTDPEHPELVDTAATPGLAFGLAYSSPILYVADGNGLTLFNCSNAAHPVQVGHLNMSGNAVAVAVSGAVAVVVGDTPDVRLVNVVNPANPLPLGTTSFAGMANDVAVEGVVAYVTDSVAGLKVVNISNFMSPSVMGTLDLPGDGRGIRLYDNLAWITGQDALFAVDVTNPAAPSVHSTTPLPGLGVDVCLAQVQGPLTTYLMVAMETETMVVFDITDDTDPQEVCSVGVPRGSTSIACENLLTFWNWIYVGGEDEGLSVISRRNLQNPPVVGAVNPPGAGVDVAVRGNHAYLADGGPVHLVDVSTASAPSILGTLPGPVLTIDLELHGTRLYVADYDFGLKIYDIGSPGSPVHLGTVDDNSITFMSVAADERYAYVVDTFNNQGLHLYDVADPANPVILGSVPDDGHLWRSVALVGPYAYVTGIGLRVIDVSDPMAPQIVTIAGPNRPSRGIDVVGDLVYVTNMDASGSGGSLSVYDASNPLTPVELVNVRTPTFGLGVDAAGDYAFVTTATDVQVFDISTPADPRPVGSRPAPRCSFHQAFATDSYLYVAHETEGLQILPIQCGVVLGVEDTPVVTATALRAYPNPFNPRTTFRYELPMAATVELAVYDLTGRLVRTLVTAQRHTAGSFEAAWSGRDDHGRPVPSGVYLGRMVAGEQRASARVTLVK